MQNSFGVCLWLFLIWLFMPSGGSELGSRILGDDGLRVVEIDGVVCVVEFNRIGACDFQYLSRELAND